MTARVALAALVLLLAGCGPHHTVRVEPTARERAQASAAVRERDGSYIVARGDTLYGIAFRHGMDYRELARLNRIAAPYTIYPGQRLRLGGRAAAPARAAGASPSRPATGTAARGGVVERAVERPAPSAASKPPSAATKPSSAAAKPPSTPAATGSKPVPATAGKGTISWRWPASGSLLSTYAANDPTRQGINIAGSAGQPVTASADGVVVYSGSGLIGYGELIIIKHSDEWLSAYGHNRKRLVAEGDAVKAGQQIAEMGRSGASRDMLHFETRRNGKPVDPLGLLPKR